MFYSSCTITSRDPAIAIILAKRGPTNFHGMRIHLDWKGLDTPNRRRRVGAYRRHSIVWCEVWSAIAKLKGAVVIVRFAVASFRWRQWWDHGEEAIGVLDEVGPWETESMEVRVNWPEQQSLVGGPVMEACERIKIRIGRGG